MQDYVKQWQDLVVEVENGYSLTIDDYLNDLSARDIIEEGLSSLEASERDKYKQDLISWDERFSMATRISKKPLSPMAQGEPEKWHNRLPILLTGELKEDVDSLGL